jgi:pimeloyl-ACP methyl ester carboxylesterase
MTMTSEAITPFTIAIDEAALTDLRERLAFTRWPKVASTEWEHGQPLAFVQDLADRWLHGFDWRQHEAALNAWPQFTTPIDGQPIHFLHVRSPEPDALPLLMMHGWPSSVFEFLDLIGPLTDPRAHGLEGAQAFHLVLPSLPGFGFSSPLASTGWNSARTARAFDMLMKRLGYARYGAVGNDVGALIGRELGILGPDGLIGVHLQQIFAFPKGEPGEMDRLTPFEREGFAGLDIFQRFAGYQAIQSKRPATLGYGLVDSPVALLAWMAELYTGFLGERAERFDKDRYLANVSLYWFTATGGSAAEIYREDSLAGTGYREERNATPTGVAVFPEDFRSVRSFAERSNAIVHWTEMPRGGHFAALDAPDLLMADVRSFFATLA